MEEPNRFDSLIEKYAHQFFPEQWALETVPLLINAQIWQESRFNPSAQSRSGAKELMQLMPATAKEMSQAAGRKSQEKPDLFDPETNINLGIKYDRVQFDHFPEIPEGEERLKFMLAS